jgi:hypothetical protein
VPILDDSKYYAFVMTMAEQMPDATGENSALRERALDRLTEAVRAENSSRGRCRDTSCEAAVRVRPWTTD